MRITADINVLLDVFQKRQPHYAASAQALSLVASGGIAGVFPAHGLTTLYYLVRKHDSKSGAEAAMDRIMRHFEIGNLDAEGWREARQLAMDAFEDAVRRRRAEKGSLRRRGQSVHMCRLLRSFLCYVSPVSRSFYAARRTFLCMPSFHRTASLI